MKNYTLRHTKQAHTTSWPGRAGEASSVVGVARAGPPGQRAARAVLPRHTTAIVVRSAFDGIL
eukprot:3717563-Prymnesium_polylepis.1